MKTDYTVYLRKTGVPVAFGTAEQCAKTLGMTVNTFWCTVNLVANGKNAKYIIVKEELYENDP